MGVLKRKNELLNLKDIDILVEDTLFDSKYFRVLECPTILTQGKSSFLIGGSSYLKSGVELKFELIHNGTGEVIYTQAVSGHLEAGSRRVSIEIYEDVEPGPATLYIVGELNPDSSDVNIPTEWQGIYNVRWTKQITINAAGVNTEPIFFYKQPTITVSEIFKGYLNVPSVTPITSSLLVSGQPRDGLQSITPTPNSVAGDYPELDFKQKANKATIEENKPLIKLTGKGGHIGSQGKLLKTNSPSPNDYIITTDSSTLVTSLYVGQEVTITSPQVDASKFTLESYHSIPTYFSSSVMKVLNETSFVTSDLFYVHDTRTSPVTLVPAPLASQTINTSYKDISTQTTSSINYVSFADMEISDLKTFSGDVHKVKIYSKAEGSLGDFEKIFDSPIESSEILFDSNEDTSLSNMGYWIDQARITKYWESYEGNNGDGGSGTLTFDSSIVIDSMKISGSNREYESELRVQVKNDLNFVANGLYTFRAKLYGTKTNKKDVSGNVTKRGDFQVYVVGDAFNKDTTEASHWGVQKLEVPEFPSGVDNYDFGTIEGNFTADNTGTGKLQFKVPSGEWYISDISVKAASDTAFNPDYVKVVAPIPPLYTRPDSVRFLVEFYDVNNNIADTVIFSDFFTFQGENTSIGGTDNILSGSMYIGNAIGSGIEMAGVSSGFIRSIGYEGFTSASEGTGQGGFLMWSGSVLPDSGDSYTGVGLELVATSESYLRYRSSPSELDIRADAFYVGNQNTQYISGSGGNIEISSSNFHLSASGDVTMTGTITATAGNIGDWIIKDGKLSGSNATLDATGAALYMSDKGPDTDSSATFDIQRDEYYIDFTPADQGNTTNYFVKFGPNFAVDSDGVLVASGAVFEGTITASAGLIGGASIESASLAYSPYWRISASADTSDPASFISSSRFKVSAGGVVTGSQVLFDGGKIAGWTISGDDLTATNMALRAGDAIEMGDATDLNTGDGVWIGNSGYFRAGDADGQRVEFNGTNLILSSSNFFLGGAGQYVSGSNGLLEISSSGFYLDNAGNTTMQGTITATAGNIGGFGISSDAIYSSNFFLSGSATGNDGTDDTNLFISSSRFKVTADGDVTGSQVLFTGGKVGGWTLTDTTLTGGVVTLNSAGSIEVGGLSDATTVATTNSGFFADSSGNVLIKGNVSGNDYLKISSGSGIDIKSQVFDLDAGTVVIDSATNSGKIALGSTPPTAHNSGNGIYFDGDAKFLIGSASGDHLQYDGTNFDVQVGSLELDATNIEISSTQQSMSLGEGKILLDGANSKITVGSTSTKQITLQGHADYGYIATGKTSATSTTAGFWLANNNTDPEFHVGNATDFIKFDGGEIDLASRKLEVSASTIQISTNESSMSFGHTSDSPQGKIIIEGKETPTFAMGPDADFISLATGSGIFMDGDGNFRFGDSDGGIVFENGNFSITGSDVDINVTDINISATGFELSSNEASMSLGTGKELLLKGGNANPFVSIGQATDAYGETGVFLGYVSSVSRPRVSYVGSAGHFKFTGTDLDIKTGTLALAASNIQLSSTQASMSLGGVPGAAANILLDGANSKIEVGSANKVTIQGGASDNFMTMGNKTSFTDYDKSTIGIIVGMDDDIPKIEMAKSGDDYLRWDSTDGLDLRTTKMEVSASNIQISSTHASMSIGDPDSSGGAIVLHADGTDKMLKFGSKTTFDQDSIAGLVMGVDGNDPRFDYTISSTQYLRMKSSGIDIATPSFKLDTDRLDIDSAKSRIEIYDADSPAGIRVRIGEVDPTTASHYGLVIYDGPDSGSEAESNELVHFSDVRNKIAGWTISTDQITSQNLILDSAGIIQTSDFASGVKGWRITSANNGEAEFEKVTIRGTLSTTVFEKESVNAVGGQLYVANSTIYTSSVQLSATDTTMSVANVGGFTSGEILSAKKISDTGFKTEYMFVNSASRDNPSSEKDLSGKLYLVRGYSGSLPGTQSTASLGDAAQASQTYESGQVLVSTGRSGSGFVRINANPNDSTTPYIDIVERTGSAIYDVELKARLGDLSGLSSGLLYGNTSPGFGLFTENVFLQGAITAQTGSFTGIVWIETDANNKMAMGRDVSGTKDGFYLNNNNYWFTNAEWKVGDTNNYLFLTGSGGSLGNDLRINLEQFELNAGGGDLKISSTEKSMSFGDGDIIFQSYDATNSWGRIGSTSTKAIYITGSSTVGAIRSGKTSVTSNTAGFWLANTDGDQEFVVGDATDYIRYSGSAVDVQTRAFELDANNGDLQLSSTQKSMSIANGAIELAYSASNQAYFKLGSTGGQGIEMTGSNYGGTIRSAKRNVSDTTAGFWLHNKAGTTEFHVGDSSEYIKFDGTDLSIASAHLDITASNIDMTTDQFELDATDLSISSTHSSMSLGYDTNTTYGVTMVGGADSYLSFGPKTSPNMILKSAGSTTNYLSIGRTFGSGVGIVIGEDSGTAKLEIYKDSDKYFTFNGSEFDLRTTKFNLSTGGGLTITGVDTNGANNKILLGAATDFDTNTGFFVDGDGDFRVGTGTSGTSFLSFNQSSEELKIKTTNLNIDTTTMDIVASGSATRLSMGSSPPTDFSSNGIILSGSGYFNFQKDANNLIKNDGTFQIKSQNFELSGSTTLAIDTEKIRLGTNATVSMTHGDIGIYLDKDGKFSFKEDVNNYIIGGDGNFEIQADTFGLGTATMVVSSSVNSGTIRLGTNGGPLTATAATQGIYMDGGGALNVYGDSSNYLRIDGSTIDMRTTTFYLSGSDITLKSPDFYLGDTSNYISGSGGNLAIYSTGNTTLSGSSISLKTPDFYLGDATNYISGSGGAIKVAADTFDLNTTYLRITDTAVASALAEGIVISGASKHILVGSGIAIEGDGDSNAGSITIGSKVTLNGSSDSRISSFYIGSNDIWGGNSSIGHSATTIVLGNLDGTSKIALGATADSLSMTAGTGVYADGDGKFKAGTATGYGIFWDASTLRVSSSDFYLGDATNYISGSGGAIDVAADTFDLSTTNLRVSSSYGSSIAMGSTIPKDLNDNGIMLSGSGEFNFQVDQDNYIRQDGNAFDIKSEIFGLKTSTMIISSSLSSGTIALGATPNTSVAGTNAGVYMDGTGDFLVRADGDNFIKFDQGSSPKLLMKADTFLLGNSTTFVSGSLGDFRIGTRLVDRDNNFKVGNVTASITVPDNDYFTYWELENASDSIANRSGKLTGFEVRYKVTSGNDHALGVQYLRNGVEVDKYYFADQGTYSPGAATASIVLTDVLSTATKFKSDDQISVRFVTKDMVPGGTATSFDSSFKIYASASFNDAMLLDSSQGLIAIGSASFGETGIQLQADPTSTDVSKFYVGKKGGAHLKFENDSIEISSSNFYLGGGGQFLSGSNGNIEISSSNFHLSASGDVNMSGTITATAGEIGGWTVGSTLSATNIVLNPAGPSIYLNGKSSFGSNVDGVWIGTDGISIGDADEFNVTHEGVLNATSATVAGTINAAGGVFTGYVEAGSGNMRFGPNVSSTNDGLWIDANNYWYTTAQGGIKASDGAIGGWTLGTSTLTSDGTTANSIILKGDDGAGSESNAITIAGVVDNRIGAGTQIIGKITAAHGEIDFTRRWNYTSGCLIAGTKVTMADGTLKNIEDVNKGDIVLSFESGSIAEMKIKKVSSPVHDELVKLEFDEVDITLTPSHPVFIKDKGWSSVSPEDSINKFDYGLDECAQLEVGDITLQYKDNEIVELELLEINEIEENETVTYTISGETIHNFFANSILVHNAVGDGLQEDNWSGSGEKFITISGDADFDGTNLPADAATAPNSANYRHMAAGISGRSFGSNIGKIDHVGVYGVAAGTDAGITGARYLAGLFKGAPVAMDSSLWVGGGRPYSGVTGAANGLNLGYSGGTTTEGNYPDAGNTAQTTAAYGINFGGDISMYRSAANTLKLEDNDVLQLGDTDAVTSALRIGSLSSVGDVTVRNNTGAAAAGSLFGVRSYFSAQDADALTVEILSLTVDCGAIKLYNNSTEKIRLNANTGITLQDDIKMFFGSTDTYIYSNSDSSEDLIIGADDDIILEPDGHIGIRATDPLSLLHIQQSTDNDDGGIRLYNVSPGTYWSQRVNSSEYLHFHYNGGSYGGYLKNDSNVGQITFTGQHRNSISTGTVNEHTGSIGYIVCADGTYDNLWDNNDNVKQDVKPNINESLPKVKLSNTAYDKTVFGVISELESNYQNTNVSESFTYNESGERILTQTTSSVYVREYNQGSFTSTMEAEDSNDQKLIINSLGEGAIWVSNYSGSLENGDYITSSPIQGLGMKQDDDLLHNYTVAKITQDCTFDMNASASYDAVEFEWSGSNYKRAFVGCTYHCG